MLADMIEGVVVANLLLPPHADRLRSELWTAVEGVFAHDVTTDTVLGPVTPIAGAA